MAQFEIFRSTINNQYYFRFKASNYKQILSSEGYSTKENCNSGIRSVKAISPYDSSYQKIDNYGNYRFNMIATNGQTVARSSEGYSDRYGRDNAINVVKAEAGSAVVIDLT
jgi:uncharacterized protein YegP (UPF0339 family)